MTAKIRLLFVTRKWPPAVGGMETYSVELVSELKKLVDLEVVRLPGRSDGRPPSSFALGSFFISSVVFLVRARKRFDAVHFGDFVLFPLAWWHSLIAPDVPRFLTVHGLDLLYGNRRGLKPFIYRRFVSWAKQRRCVNCFIANSCNTAEIVMQSGFKPVTTIPLGVRIPEGFSSVSVIAKVPYILFVGRLVKRKGAAWFAENVMPLLPEKVEFHVVGKTWDQDEERRLRQVDKVKLYGFVSDDELARLKAGARVIVMPNMPSADNTDVEGFGLVALEAAISGTPLVAANTEGLSDAVIDGCTGFLVEPGNTQAWAAKLAEIMSWNQEHREVFFRSAIMNVREHYAWRRVAQDTLKTFLSFT